MEQMDSPVEVFAFKFFSMSLADLVETLPTTRTVAHLVLHMLFKASVAADPPRERFA